MSDCMRCAVTSVTAHDSTRKCESCRDHSEWIDRCLSSKRREKVQNAVFLAVAFGAFMAFLWMAGV